MTFPISSTTFFLDLIDKKITPVVLFVPDIAANTEFLIFLVDFTEKFYILIPCIAIN